MDSVNIFKPLRLIHAQSVYKPFFSGIKQCFYIPTWDGFRQRFVVLFKCAAESILPLLRHLFILLRKFAVKSIWYSVDRCLISCIKFAAKCNWKSVAEPFTSVLQPTVEPVWDTSKQRSVSILKPQCQHLISAFADRVIIARVSHCSTHRLCGDKFTRIHSALRLFFFRGFYLHLCVGSKQRSDRFGEPLVHLFELWVLPSYISKPIATYDRAICFVVIDHKSARFSAARISRPAGVLALVTGRRSDHRITLASRLISAIASCW
ncbi:hypothetical protein MPH_05759 [Macrophomina phaseolina MS6]|uniref:Uncharacterized protein n=1 Tax=Macrophomina phaseolina (strain MS6) TaxID=1126212 RepID=K2S3L6_MACPH|nr:hypothetical protein MPH_05759 [Macrophomina phaseolina MS6]